MKISETGRSMVEMLGVLAIMGVLTVGVMLGYRYAMDRILTNSIITGVRARSVIIGQQRVLGHPLNLSEFHPDTEKDLIYGRFEVKAFNNYEYEGEASQALEVYNIPRRVCENIRMLTFPDETITLVNGSEMGECITDGEREDTGGLHDGGDYFTAEYHNVVTFIFAGLGEACSVNQDCLEGLCCVSLEEGGRGCLPCDDPTDCDPCQEWKDGKCVNKAEGARCLWTPSRDGCCTAGVCGACPDRCEGNTCDRLCQTCDSETGACVNKDNGTDCGTCEKCENGACVADTISEECKCPGGCGECEVCENGACLNKMTQITKCDGTTENCCPLTTTCTDETGCVRECTETPGPCQKCDTTTGQLVEDTSDPSCHCGTGEHWDTSDAAKYEMYTNYGARQYHVYGEGACCPAGYWVENAHGSECCLSSGNYWNGKDSHVCCAQDADYVWDTTDEAKKANRSNGQGACCHKNWWNGESCCITSFPTKNLWSGKVTQSCCEKGTGLEPTLTGTWLKVGDEYKCCNGPSSWPACNLCANKTCGECQKCDESTGECVSDMTLPGCTLQCTTNTDCGACEKCENGACVSDLTLPGCTPQCTANADCGTCERCVSGVCQPDSSIPGCGGECPGGCGECEVCQEGKCVSNGDACCGVTCGSCEECQEGKCVSRCQSTEKCEDNVCVPKGKCDDLIGDELTCCQNDKVWCNGTCVTGCCDDALPESGQKACYKCNYTTHKWYVPTGTKWCPVSKKCITAADSKPYSCCNHRSWWPGNENCENIDATWTCASANTTVRNDGTYYECSNNFRITQYVIEVNDKGYTTGVKHITEVGGDTSEDLPVLPPGKEAKYYETTGG